MEKARTIKFRAYDKVNKKMFTSFRYENIMGEQFVGGAISIGNDVSYEVSDGEWAIMQFTGLKDKNGKEIYESDYCMVGDVKVEIMFVDGAFGFEDPLKPGTLALLPQFQLEVIGNKYESK